ncbi:hypothetical protein HYQ45_002194 [Verticillium longisporum]|uniref:Uncharacterized protein n=3 Tax=Verticillium TaxID=1036719 RepID=G2X9M9_VERDV|nr:uncharacterized protein VDAG_06861 [Verticillium dahliae VdLs.17]KAF3342488.1 Elongation factor G 1 [Verticillium dahliae VDG2]KAF3356008.1 NAD-dependent deacetylase sir2A [Verticillium dahliae VDG1]KAG7141211.1 hypothetical protein HYQ45_002194 [Verticillium longisporum]KAH6697705.1 hypothetical protein EV126DRAFT_452806 [Verticillium dahliae]EGY15697.1 hypothetical protein VDAG_06861 [Verticillium dahliae VdLs.17]
MNYRIFHRKWPSAKRYMWFNMLAELLCMVPLLVLFGIAQPNTWRTKMWQIGYENGWNSDPRMILYAHANYRPLPKIPFVWSQSLTDFNVALTLVSLFSLIVRMVLFIMKVYYPLIALIFNIILTALWTTSMYGQMGPDHADPERPSNIAWYITRSCAPAGGRHNAEKSCRLAKASFAVTVLMLAVVLVNLGMAVWGMWPTEDDKHPHRKNSRWDDDSDDDDDDDNVESDRSSPVKTGGQWEMASMAGGKGPASPRVMVQPYTPRTMAFQTLDRKLPLRQQYG